MKKYAAMMMEMRMGMCPMGMFPHASAFEGCSVGSFSAA